MSNLRLNFSKHDLLALGWHGITQGKRELWQNPDYPYFAMPLKHAIIIEQAKTIKEEHKRIGEYLRREDILRTYDGTR